MKMNIYYKLKNEINTHFIKIKYFITNACKESKISDFVGPQFWISKQTYEDSCTKL